MTDELDGVFGMVERMAVLGETVTKMPELESHVAYFETDAGGGPEPRPWSWLGAMLTVVDRLRIHVLLASQEVLAQFPNAASLSASYLERSVRAAVKRRWPHVTVIGSLVPAIAGLHQLERQPPEAVMTDEQKIQARVGILATYALIYSAGIPETDTVLSAIIREHSECALMGFDAHAIGTVAHDALDLLKAHAMEVRGAFSASVWSGKSGDPWNRRTALSVKRASSATPGTP